MTDEKRKPKLLIVEDDYENQRFLQIFLKRTFELDLCDNSDDFYDRINNTKFDIIYSALVDTLKEKTGIEV